MPHLLAYQGPGRAALAGGAGPRRPLARAHRARSTALKPDFSGEWLLDRSASALGGGSAAIQSALVRIEHREPAFRLSATFLAGDRTIEFSFERQTDGREIAGGNEVSRLYWAGRALVSEDRSVAPDEGPTMRWRFELIDAGQGLRAVEQIGDGDRQDENVWIFRRR